MNTQEEPSCCTGMTAPERRSRSALKGGVEAGASKRTTDVRAQLRVFQTTRPEPAAARADPAERAAHHSIGDSPGVDRVLALGVP